MEDRKFTSLNRKEATLGGVEAVLAATLIAVTAAAIATSIYQITHGPKQK